MTYTEDLASSVVWGDRQWDHSPFWWTIPPLNERIMIWTPPPVERRMTRQHGAFLIGEVPTGREPGIRQLPDGKLVAIPSFRRIVSIKKRAYTLGGAGHPPGSPQILYTARVAAAAKEAITAELDTLMDISTQTMYGDVPGYVESTRNWYPGPLLP